MPCSKIRGECIDMKTFFIIALFVATFETKAEYPNFWKNSAYAIKCDNNNVRDVLNDFGKSFGVVVNISEDVGGNCDGWIRFENAIQFLDNFTYEHHLEWYFFKNNLYVSNISANVTKRLKVDSNLKQALKDIGLFTKKFGWGELKDKQVAIVTGPYSYVRKVQDLSSSSFDKKSSPHGDNNGSVNTHVFRLKYASVVDREINVRDKTYVIPGAHNILSGIIHGTSEAPNSVTIKDKRKNTDELGKLVSAKNSNSLSIESDVRTNSIFIHTKKNDIRRYKDIIKMIDIKQNMIEIDAVIVDISREKLKEIGVNLQYASKDDKFSFESRTASGSLTNLYNGASTLFIDNIGEFYTNLKLLESDGNASIIANTSILTMENQPAVIDLSETVFIQTIGERVVNLDDITTGTLLNVTPTVIDENGQNKIKMFVEIEDGKIIKDTANGLPSVTKSNINTRAIVDENKSLVVGGYHSQTNSNVVNKVPKLSEIPIIGNIFTNKQDNISHKERIFILTPRISRSHHNPEDYIYYSDKNEIASYMAIIEDRWFQANSDYVTKSLKLFEDVANNRIPIGYSIDTHSERSTISCTLEGVNFEFDHQPVMVGHGIKLIKVKATNQSKESIYLVEHACSGKGLIGVMLDHSEALLPKQFGHIYMTLDEKRTRPHLTL